MKPSLAAGAVLLMSAFSGRLAFAQDPSPDSRRFRTIGDLLSFSGAEPRIEGAKALGNIALHLHVMLSNLRRALSDRDPSVRREAARALGYIGPSGNRALPDLLKALDDPDPGVQAAVISAVTSM